MFRNLLPLALVAGMAATSPGHAAVDLGLDVPAGTQFVGSPFTVDVNVSGIPDGQDLGFFDIDVAFDAELLALEAVTLTSELGAIAANEAVDTSLPPLLGLVNVSVLSLLDALPAQPSAFTLATLTLTPVAAGSGLLEFGFVGLENALGEPVAANLSSASVSAVPLPAGLWLFAAGAGAVRLAARRRAA